MAYKTTITLTRQNSNIPFKRFVDQNLANYLRQKFPQDDFLSTRKVLKFNDVEWVGEITYQSESSYFAVQADPTVSAARSAWNSYNMANNIVEKTVNVSI